MIISLQYLNMLGCISDVDRIKNNFCKGCALGDIRSPHMLLHISMLLLQHYRRGVTSNNHECMSIYHGKAHIGFLQSWTVIGSIPCYCHNLPLLYDAAVDDSLKQIDKKEAVKYE